MENKDKLLEALAHIIEPDLKKDIVALNLVEDISIEANKISFTVKVSNPAMHSRRRMHEACVFHTQRVFGKEVEVDVNVIGLKTEEREPEQRKILPGVKHIIAVSSGKGGVGKSTVTANLAAGLAMQGHKVGLVDADIYGPSVPIMFDCVNERPEGTEQNGRSYIKPLTSHGVKLLSIGFFADANQAVVWRGPMASKALEQMFKDVWWEELDYMLIDLPPGTGDIHLSLVQSIPLTGAIIVSTPQEVALMDARKGIEMFQLENINIPIVGVVENMAYFTPPELPDNKYYIFGKEGAQQLADQKKVPFLGEIPIVESIREAGDIGRPAVMQGDTETAKAFLRVIKNMKESLSSAEKPKKEEIA